MKAKYRRSKRMYTPKTLALVLILTSVFLVGAKPEKANAAELQMLNPQLNQSILQLQELKTEGERKKEKLDAIMPAIQELQKQEQAVEQAKQELAAATSELEKEVAELKVKVAEKRRLEALRIVTVTKYAGNSAGNTYALGNCTWYAKSKRPDLPNNLGNANTWYSRAAAEGFRVGTEAKTNAIGTTTRGSLGHVVYVEKWLGDGQILISEMNYAGLYSQRTRVASESEFVYIYEMR